MSDWMSLNHRAFPVITTAAEGFGLMQGRSRLRVDRSNGLAAIVGNEKCLWIPVPLAVADAMISETIGGTKRLHRVLAETVGDRQGGRLGYRDLGYDGNVAEWYCWTM